MAKSIMVLGTMSSAGKSLIAAALCRILNEDGYKVAPFKAQNMALNSFITKEGLEMGRAQVMQAEAARTTPDVRMNPILLKPNSNTGSQVIVNGKVEGNMTARQYYARKKELVPEVKKAYESLAEEYDVIVLEGAGSPAEINLREYDLVNMGMAELIDAPVILVGDIDRGGVFAQLFGTVKLLETQEQERIKGMVINKFRGDVSILEPGLEQIEALTNIPVLGVVPYMDIDLDEEDSLSSRLVNKQTEAIINIAVIRFPRISNYTDMAAFEQCDEVNVYYVSSVKELGQPDMTILPGSKSTISDLRWMRQNGLEAALLKYVSNDGILFGICGGYQMLGKNLQEDEEHERGMGLLDFDTTFEKQKTRTQVKGKFSKVGGALYTLSNQSYTGYEIHHGQTVIVAKENLESIPLGYSEIISQVQHEIEDSKEVKQVEITSRQSMTQELKDSMSGMQCGNIYGTYVHGIFDEEGIAEAVIKALCEKKGLDEKAIYIESRESYKEKQYQKLAEVVRSSLDMEKIYQIINGE